MNSVPEAQVAMWPILFGAIFLLVIGGINVALVVKFARGRVLAAVFSAFAFLAGMVLIIVLVARTSMVVVQQDGGPRTVITRQIPPATLLTVDTSAPLDIGSQPTDAATNANSSPDSELAKLPGWVSQPETTTDRITTLVLSSQRFVTQAEAEEQLTAELVNRTRQYFHDEHPSRGMWTLPADYAVRTTVKQRHVEIISKTFAGDMTVDMKRIHWQVQLSPDIRKDLYPIWRTQVVEQRLIQVGGGVGFATFLLLTGMAYFRVDSRTQGAYRGWLRFAALSVAAAGGAAACLVA